MPENLRGDFFDSHCTYSICYLRRRLASGEGIVTVGVTLSRCESVCPRRTATARRISLGGEGNALYPVLSMFYFVSIHFCLFARRSRR